MRNTPYSLMVAVLAATAAIGAHAQASEFGVNAGTTTLRVFVFFKDQDAGTFSHDKAVSIFVEGTARSSGIAITFG